MTTKTERRPLGSVQREVVRVRHVRDGVLYLASRGGRGEQIRGVAVLEVGGTNFSLGSEDERAALVLGYQALLRVLPPGRSLQILIHRVPYDLSEYTGRLDTLASNPRVPRGYRDLAAAHADYAERLSLARPLFSSRYYVVLSSSPERHATGRSFRFFKRDISRARGIPAAIRMDLDIQCERVLSALVTMGLSATRAGDATLVQLAARCLLVGKGTRQRALPDPARLALDRPVSIAQGARPRDLIALQHTQPMVRLQDRNVPLTPPISRPQEVAPESLGQILPGFSHLADLLSPAAILEQPDQLQVEEDLVRHLAVISYPREIAMGYLAPLLLYDDEISIAMHIHMQDPTAMLRRYRRRKAELRANRRVAAKRGWVESPDDDVAADDVERLLLQVASREEALCELGCYIQVCGRTRASLDERCARLLATLKDLFLAAHPTTFEHLAAYQAMQPWSLDALRRTTLLDTMSVAYGFPFLSNAMVMPGGVLEGTTTTGDPVVINSWSRELDNPHRFIGGVTGAGKSYGYKVKMLREAVVRFEEGLQQAVIDPEGECQKICRHLEGCRVHIAPGSAHRLNPFDLVVAGIDPRVYLASAWEGNRLDDKVLDLIALYDLMLSENGQKSSGQLSPSEKGLLERATYEAYQRCGITRNPLTHGRHPPPTLRDVYGVLAEGVAGKDTYGLCDRLYRFVEGSFAGLFSGTTNVRPDERFVVFDVREMRGDLRPIGTFLIADFMWTQMLSISRPRILYIDEAWSLIRHREGGRFLSDLARRARKRGLSIVIITQSPELFVADEFGAVIAGNCAMKVLKRQDRTSADAVATRFGLSLSERQKLLTLQKPEALLLAGSTRLVVAVEANPLEHQLAHTDPPWLTQAEEERPQEEGEGRDLLAPLRGAWGEDATNGKPSPLSSNGSHP